MSTTPSKNARVIYAYRKPVMHFFVCFCIYQQFKSLDHRCKEDAPLFIRWLREAHKVKQTYWEKMCDLKRKE